MSTMTKTERRSIWRNRDFRLLWLGHTVSMFGSQITRVALPLVAALALAATPAQMALLQGLGYAPATVLGLFAGVWVDRVRRRPLMIAGDLISTALLLALPLATWAGLLRLELVYALAFGLAAVGVLYGLADGAFLPVLLKDDELVAGNGALATSDSVARIAGPGLAGALVQLLGAPFAVLLDALSFLVSALSAWLIRTPEPPPPPVEHRASVWREIGAGLGVLWRNPYLRAFQLTFAWFDLFWNALYAVYILYITRSLGLGASAVGLILGIGSIGALIGSLAAAPAARRLGPGRTLIAAELVLGLGGLAIVCAAWFPTLALPLLIAAELVQSCAATIFGINAGSVRQLVTPDRMQGRMRASTSAIGLGVALLGTALGGFLGETIGVVATVAVCAAGSLPAFLWLVFSPVRSYR
jgi:MFS family permease